jgi:ABC-2 type transport system permease protein
VTRIFVVAKTEFLALVRTKAFIIGILMVPVLIGLSIAFQIFAARQTDREDHKFAVIDDTGVLFGTLETAAAEHNREAGSGEARTGPHFLPERAPAGAADRDALVADLSDRVRSKALFAFVELPASLLDTSTTERDQLRYYTETPSYTSLPNWIRSTIERDVTHRRLASASIDATLIDRLTRDTSIATLGLVTRDATGRVGEARRVNELQTFVVPFAMMYLLFIAVMSAAPPLLTAVVEEKMSRISEVLIASIPPSHLMAGKLLGVSAVSAVLALLYVGGGLYALVSAGQVGLVAPALIGWFVLFLFLSVLLYGAVFVAIGAACSDLKDSQSMMQPVMIFLMLPLLASPVVIRAPESALSIGLSLVPTATPFLMLTRLAMTPPPPMWQVALGVALTAITTAFCVYAAGKIFRVGLLMQGKPPNLPELLRWIRR